jgi:hypothetical protein
MKMMVDYGQGGKSDARFPARIDLVRVDVPSSRDLSLYRRASAEGRIVTMIVRSV